MSALASGGYAVFSYVGEEVEGPHGLGALEPHVEDAPVGVAAGGGVDAAGLLDGVTMTNGDALVTGGTGKPSVGIIINDFYDEKKRYPDSLAEVDLDSLKDPWGNPYQYLNPGNNGEIDIYTLGRDGRPGGEGIDADIGNWNLE